MTYNKQELINSLTPVAYQVISRNNDTNGNPFRLILVYNAEFKTIRAVECRSSSPNYLHNDDIKSCVSMPKFHLSPSEYKATKSCYKQLGILEHSH